MLKKVFVVCTFNLESSNINQILVHASCKNLAMIKLEYLFNAALEFRSLAEVHFILPQRNSC